MQNTGIVQERDTLTGESRTFAWVLPETSAALHIHDGGVANHNATCSLEVLRKVHSLRSKEKTTIIDQGGSRVGDDVVGPYGSDTEVASDLFEDNETVVDTGLLTPKLERRAACVSTATELNGPIVGHGV